MKPENEINEEVRQLLDSIEEHGKNRRRQQQLSELMDSLSEKEKPLHSPLSTFFWWAIGAAAACLLLWLLVKPNAKQQPEMEQEILVEETQTVDTVKTEVNDVVFEEPVAHETFLAEETPVVPQNAPMKKEKPKTQIIEEVVEQPTLAEVTPTKLEDTANIESNTITTTSETPSAVQKPQRRVIRSLNLVCYECQKDPEFFTKPVMEDRTLFGQPQDQNMKNGSLALEIKLN